MYADVPISKRLQDGGAMSATIREVATAAGVSTATVSRALRGLPYVDEATRRRVVETAQRLDYVASPSASRLASGRTGTIAVLTPYVARWFFATVISGVAMALTEGPLDLLLVEVGNPERPSTVPLEQRLRSRADGAVAIALPDDHPEISQLIEHDFPLTVVGSLSDRVSSVAINDIETGRLATQHLINLGHRDIGLISGATNDDGFATQDDRTDGYNEALTRNGITPRPSLTSFGSFTREGGERAMVELLSRETTPTAVFCLSDEMAFGAIIALRRHGLTPGIDVALVGVDGHPQSELANLTTVAQPVAEMGRLAALALQEKLSVGESYVPSKQSVSVELIVRSSSAPPKGN
jgi:DNA-binding LacI/PurR family transcriptional regulator